MNTSLFQIGDKVTVQGGLSVGTIYKKQGYGYWVKWLNNGDAYYAEDELYLAE